MRRAVFVLIGVGLAAILVLGLTQRKGTSNAAPRSAEPARVQAKLAGAPKPLASLHAQANRLLPGSPDTVKQRLAGLRGYPVVVNMWASWCGPCRFEFPFLQRTSVTFGKQVAFFGINAGDNHGDAANFLKRFPVSYPHYEDPRYAIAFSLKAPQGLPVTLFYSRDGKLSFVHQGGYQTQAKLEEDIRRYALGRA